MKWTDEHCYIKNRSTELFRLTIFQDREGTWRATLLDSRIRGYVFEKRSLSPMTTEVGAKRLALKLARDAIAMRAKEDAIALARLEKHA